MGIRREAREYALQMLYAFEKNKSLAGNELFRIFREENFILNDKVRIFAEEIVAGVLSNQKEIDAIIVSKSKNWSLSRMPVVDLNIMRVAAYELLYCPDIPKKVSINEAIEVAKKYGDKDSPSFVNGILDEIEPGNKEERGV